MKNVVFVSIDKPSRWSKWHSTSTDSVYFSDFLETDTDVEEFIQQVKTDYPDSNFIDGSSGHEWFIKYVILKFDPEDTEGFKTLCQMTRAYYTYKERQIK